MVQDDVLWVMGTSGKAPEPELETFQARQAMGYNFTTGEWFKEDVGVAVGLQDGPPWATGQAAEQLHENYIEQLHENYRT